MRKNMNIKELASSLDSHEMCNQIFENHIDCQIGALRSDLESLIFVILDKSLRTSTVSDKEIVFNKMRSNAKSGC